MQEEQRSELEARIGWIQQWHALRYLDLTHNNFQRLDPNFFLITQRLGPLSSCRPQGRCGVNIIEGNPIEELSLTAMNSSRVVDFLRTFGRAVHACANRIKILKISAMTGPVESVWNMLSESCFLDQLRALSFTTNTVPTPVLRASRIDFLSRVSKLDLTGNGILRVEEGAWDKFARLKHLAEHKPEFVSSKHCDKWFV